MCYIYFELFTQSLREIQTPFVLMFVKVGMWEENSWKLFRREHSLIMCYLENGFFRQVKYITYLNITCYWFTCLLRDLSYLPVTSGFCDPCMWFIFYSLGGRGGFLEGKVGTSKWIESPATGVLGCYIFFKAGIRNIRSWVGKFPRCTPWVILSRYHQDFKLCFGEKWMIEFHCSYSIFSRACLLVQDCAKCYRWGLRALLRVWKSRLIIRHECLIGRLKIEERSGEIMIYPSNLPW